MTNEPDWVRDGGMSADALGLYRHMLNHEMYRDMLGHTAPVADHDPQGDLGPIWSPPHIHQARPEMPARLVDVRLVTWQHAGHGLYAAIGHVGLPVRTLDELRAQRAPVRTVAPPPDHQIADVVDLLAGCRYTAVGTVAYAFCVVTMALITRYGRGAEQALIAGGPGTWEADVVRDMALHVGPDCYPGVYEPEVGRRLGGILADWVTGDPTPNLPELTSVIMGEVVDRLGGWHEVTEPWLLAQPSVKLIEGWATINAACSRWGDDR